MTNLKPRFERAGTVLIEELDSVLEVIFIQDGVLAIGYEINKVDVSVFKNPPRTALMIGAYNCTFNKRAIFFYKCWTNIHGYFIPKREWKELLNDFPAIAENFKKNVIENYTDNIKDKVLESKNISMAKLKRRHDI